MIIQNKRHDGFIRSMGSIDNPESILHMYKNGYIAATNNYKLGVGNIIETEDGTSHPLLEDNNVADDGVGSNKYFGSTWDRMTETVNNKDRYKNYYGEGIEPEYKDGWLAWHTYL